MWMLSRLVIIADTGGDRQRGRQITGMFGMDSAGRLLGPPAAFVLAAVWDIRAAFIAHAVLSLIAIIPSLQVQESAPGRRSTAGQVSQSGGRLSTLAGLIKYSLLMFFVAQLLASRAESEVHDPHPNEPPPVRMWLPQHAHSTLPFDV